MLFTLTDSQPPALPQGSRRHSRILLGHGILVSTTLLGLAGLWGCRPSLDITYDLPGGSEAIVTASPETTVASFSGSGTWEVQVSVRRKADASSGEARAVEKRFATQNGGVEIRLGKLLAPDEILDGEYYFRFQIPQLSAESHIPPKTLVLDRRAPEVFVQRSLAGKEGVEEPLPESGTMVLREAQVRVRIVEERLREVRSQGARVFPDSQGRLTVNVPTTGRWTLEAQDAAGNETIVHQEIRIDLAAPALIWTSWPEGALTSPELEATLRVTDDTSVESVTATLDGSPVEMEPLADSKHRLVATIPPGEHVLAVEAVDRGGRRSQVERRVLGPEAPSGGVANSDVLLAVENSSSGVAEEATQPPAEASVPTPATGAVAVTARLGPVPSPLQGASGATSAVAPPAENAPAPPPAPGPIPAPELEAAAPPITSSGGPVLLPGAVRDALAGTPVLPTTHSMAKPHGSPGTGIDAGATKPGEEATPQVTQARWLARERAIGCRQDALGRWWIELGRSSSQASGGESGVPPSERPVEAWRLPAVVVAVRPLTPGRGIFEVKTLREEGVLMAFVDPRGFRSSRASQEFQRPFLMDVTEVTVARFERFLESSGRRKEVSIRGPEFRSPDQPVTLVSWDDASAFCVWATRALPTADAFDAAALWDGAEVHAYPWGARFEDGELSSTWQTVPGAVTGETRDISAWGIRALAGGCHEWTATPADRQPGSRLARGGSQVHPRSAWGTPAQPRPEDLSVSWAKVVVPVYRAVDLSFRTILALESPAAESATGGKDESP